VLVRKLCNPKKNKHGKQRHAAKQNSHSAGGLRIVALFEGAKGVLVLLTGFGVMTFIHQGLHHAASQLVQHLHLNPASHYPAIFLDVASRVSDTPLWAIAIAALLYASIHITEAYGLWMQRQWAEWFGLLTGALYISFELYEVTLGVTWPKITVLVVNSIIVVYLLSVILKSGKRTMP